MYALRAADEVKTFPAISLPPPNAESTVGKKVEKEPEKGRPPIDVVPKSRFEPVDLTSFAPVDPATSTLSEGSESSAPKTPNPKARKMGDDESLVELRNYASLMDQYSLNNFMIYNGKVLKSTPEFQSFRKLYANDWGAIQDVIIMLEVIMTTSNVKLAIINGVSVFELALLNLPFISREEALRCVDNLEQIQPMLQSISKSGAQLVLSITKMQSLIRQWLARNVFRKKKNSIESAVRIQNIAKGWVVRNRLFSKYRCYNEIISDYWLDNSLRLQKIVDMRTELLNAKKNTMVKTVEMELMSPGSTINTAVTIDNDIVPPKNLGKLVIHVPTVGSSTVLREKYGSQLHIMENMFLSCLHELRDPDVEVVYVSPVPTGDYEIEKHHRFMSQLGIETEFIANRVHFIVPELIHSCPQHMSLAQVLWCSSEAMRKLKHFIVQHNYNAVIVPTNITWVEKRLSYYLKVPVLAPDVASILSMNSRSFQKNILAEANFNLPVGVHDLHTQNDVTVSLARLVAGNIDVNRWIMRLNYSINNEGVAVIDVGNWSLVAALRSEYNTLQKMNENDPNFWFSRSTQISVRKRVLKFLQSTEGENAFVIGRLDVYPTWELYCHKMSKIGATLEAEAPGGMIGYVRGLCFIDPTSVDVDRVTDELGPTAEPTIQTFNGSEILLDDWYCPQSSMYPQTKIPAKALENATHALASLLASKYQIIGYLSVDFMVIWDYTACCPKMWAMCFSFGKNTCFDCVGIVNGHQPQTLVPNDKMDTMNSRLGGAKSVPGSPASSADFNFTKGFPSAMVNLCGLKSSAEDPRYCIHFPMLYHEPLTYSCDKSFDQMSLMDGISFDTQAFSGTIFFLVDGVKSGCVSFICIEKSRKEVLHQALHVLSFISQRFGKSRTKKTMDSFNSSHPVKAKHHVWKWNCVNAALANMKLLVKRLDEAAARKLQDGS